MEKEEIDIKKVDCFLINNPKNGQWCLTFIIYNFQKLGGHCDFPGEERSSVLLPINSNATIDEARIVANAVWNVMKNHKYEGAEKGKMYPRNPVLCYEYKEVIEE